MVDSVEQVNARPFKRFFIDIITRDIGLVAAILDLVDNSVDSARELRPDASFNGLYINISATPTEFSIEDNCAGITVANAKDYVFRMGRASDDPIGHEGSIGQFGVGLKRSLFKLGTNFIVHSASSAGSFSLELDVDAWEKIDEWAFDLTVHDREKHETTGTTIAVSSLNPAVAAALATQATLDDLKRDLTSRHRLAIGNGLQVFLNNELLVGVPSQVAASELISPAVETFTMTAPNGSLVEIEVVAGVAPSHPDVSEDAEPEDVKYPAADAGWHIFGNGRLLLATEKTALTGWGGGKLPLFHNQYARFRGFVYLRSADSSAIPWNTMKTGVDVSDPVWLAAKESMIATGRQIITMLNHLKVERQAGAVGAAAPITQALAATRSESIQSTLNRIYSSTFTTEEPDKVYSISMIEIRSDTSSAASYPAPNPDLGAGDKRISYMVSTVAFSRVSEALQETKATQVGRQTFDIFHKSL